MSFSFPSNPTTGQQYAVSGGPTYTWNGTAWVVLTPGQQFARQSYTATASQYSFTVTSGYLVGGVDVYRNGVKLITGTDYVANNGTSIVLTLPANSGDSVEVISYPQIVYSNALKITGDTMTGNLTVPNITSNVAVTAVTGTYSGTVTANNIVASNNVTYSGALTGGTGIVNIGSGQIYKDASGNVGIGTSSPLASLHIAKQSLIFSGTGNPYGMYLYPTSSGESYLDVITGSSSGTDINIRTYSNGIYNSLIKSALSGTTTIFQTGGSERMRIDSSGNVGIGTSSPSSYGKLVVTGGYGAFLSGSSGALASLSVGRTTPEVTIGVAAAGGNYFSGAVAGDVALAYGSGNLLFGSGNIGSAGTERMRLDSSGRLTFSNQPAFDAIPPASYTLNGGDQTVAGTWSEVTDRNNNFNPANGTFTAPVAGFYHFTWSSFVTSTSTRNDAYILVNGGTRVRSEISGYAAGTTNRSSMVSVTTYLAANDNVTVGVYINGTGSTYSSPSPWGRFSGFLVG